MKRLLTFCFMTFAFVMSHAQGYQTTDYGIKASIKTKNIDVEIQWFTPQTIRIVKYPTGTNVDKKSLSVIATPLKQQLQTSQKGNIVTTKSKLLCAHLNTATGVVTFIKPNGEILLSEVVDGFAFSPINDAGRSSYSTYQAFDTDEDEALYGLGQLQNGLMSQRDIRKVLVQGNQEDVTPFFQSTKGYGIFWDNYSATTYEDNSKGNTSFGSEVADCIDYYFIYGGDADGVIAQTRELTGHVPMMPLWYYGFMQSRERYKNQHETMEVVRKYREAEIPLDCIIQDWQYWGNNYVWNAMEFLSENFSQAPMMIDSIHNMNAHIMISIWSSFGPMTKQYEKLNKEGMLFDFDTWPMSGVNFWPPNLKYRSGVKVYDCYNPKARDIYWQHLNEGLFSLGIDAWWMDSTDPDHFNHKKEDFDHQTYLGSFRSVRNAYPLMTVGGVSDHQRATTDKKRVCILTRSGFLGQQRYGANVWTGDVQSTWDVLRRQIPAGLNFSLTGMPHWNTDLGGFFCNSYNHTWAGTPAYRNPLYHELYVRWTQFGVFCPMMRSHGTDTPREIYLYGEKGEAVYDALVEAVKLRYALLPYIYSTAWQVTNQHSTFMRALFMDFRNDKKTWNINDQYMFGKALLVAPIVEAQYTPEKLDKTLKENEGWTKSSSTSVNKPFDVDFTTAKSTRVYLPAETKWFDFFTGKEYDGGQEIELTTHINSIPLFARAGSIIPIGPDVQFSDEKRWDNLTLKVYPGADGSFTLYEDEGDTYNYEKGAFTEIPMTWNNKNNTLTIGARKGNYNGMLSERIFVIELPNGKQYNVTYKGKQVKVKIR